MQVPALERMNLRSSYTNNPSSGRLKSFFFGSGPAWAWLAAPAVLIILGVFCAAVGLIVATITVYLPCCLEKDIAKDIPAVDIPRSQRPTVLIVDDSAEVAEVTSSLFERLGYDTDYRDSADAALKYLAEGTKIDLVFSDIVMPGTIDGVGLAREIRSRYPDLPVVLTTGYSDAAQAAPADLKILRKPFDTVALRGFIADTMAVDLAS